MGPQVSTGSKGVGSPGVGAIDSCETQARVSEYPELRSSAKAVYSLK